MAIHKATLAKEIDGVVEYIYPKTTADIVQYDDNYNVVEKFALISTEISDLNTSLSSDISDLTSAINTSNTNITANANAIEALKEDVETNALNIATNSARMDTFTALDDGSTSGDAELQDIRVGYSWDDDGTMQSATYDTAGEAVRQQVSALSGEIIMRLYKFIYTILPERRLAYGNS